MSRRQTHSTEFKVKFAMEAISGRKSFQEIAADHAIHTINYSQWKRQLLDDASQLFTGATKPKTRTRGKLRRLSCSSRSAGCRWSWSGSKKRVNSCDARGLRQLVDHDQPQLSVSRQCALLGLARSTLYYQPTEVRKSTLRIMAKIEDLYLEDPCSGSQRMAEYLAIEGIPISRDRVQNLMRCMGLRAIYQKPRP